MDITIIIIFMVKVVQQEELLAIEVTIIIFLLQYLNMLKVEHKPKADIQETLMNQSPIMITMISLKVG